MHKTTRILRDEHRSIAAVLHGFLSLVRACKDPQLQPQFDVLHSMIYYIDAFPERMHHPKEDDFLFARLAQRSPEAVPLIQELRAEHLAGARMIRELEAALLAFEVNGRPALPPLLEQAEAYARFHWDHMGKEENRLLPLAERDLTEADWRQVDDAFSGNEDPISDLREKDFDALFKRIVSLAPDPVGVGQRWKTKSPA
jgi:hemerythrin-like domain-containing protein